MFNTVAEGDVVHLVYGGGRIAYRRRAADGEWGPELGITRYRGGGHTTIGLVEPGRVAVAWLNPDDERVMMREVEGETLHPPMVLIDTRDLGGFASQRLRINLNGLQRSEGRFRTAVAATIGSGPTYTTWVATRPQ